MKRKVVLYKTIPDSQRARLEAHFDLKVFDGINENNQSEFLAALKEAEGLIGSSCAIPATFIANSPNIKAVSTISVGVDDFDVTDLSRRHIPLMHTPSVLTNTTADTIFALIMSSARRVVELSNMVNSGHWKHSLGQEHYGTDVHSKTLGIIGMGRIGYAVAKRGNLGFDMKIYYVSNHRHDEAEEKLGATRVDLDTLLACSDFVCPVVPLTPQTEKLIGRDELAKMKPGAILVNGSRGKVIDESALIDALQQKIIYAAGLDVFDVEPLPEDSPLCRLDNAVLFPHMGSATHETRLAMVTCAVDNLIAALEGDLSQHCVNISACLKDT